MNTQGFEAKKDGISNKEDEAAAVFVLPPHLLQQLGINLQSIECTPNHPAAIEGNEERAVPKCNNSESGNDKANESSILETASLIKDTVLLSPSYIPTIANTIPGEVEIANINKNFEKCNFKQKKICNKYINSQKNIEITSAAKKFKPSVIKYTYGGIKIKSEASDAATCKKYSIGDITQAGINNNVSSNTNIFTNDNTKQLIHEKTNDLEKINDEMFIIQHDSVYSSDCSHLQPNRTSVAIHSMMSSRKTNDINDLYSNDKKENKRQVLDEDNHITEIMVDGKSYCHTSSTVEGVATLDTSDNAQQSCESVCVTKTRKYNVTNRRNTQVEAIYDNFGLDCNTTAGDKTKWKNLNNKETSKFFSKTEEICVSNNNNSEEISNTYEKNYQINKTCKGIEIQILSIEKEIDYCSDSIVNEEYISDQSNYFPGQDNLDPANSDTIVVEKNQNRGLLKTPYNKNVISSNCSIEDAIKTPVNTNIPADNVENLSEFVNCYPSRNNMLKIQNDVESLQSDPKTNIVESKLCIQGVEKPGGMRNEKELKDFSMPVKTYKRNKKQEMIFAITNTEILGKTTESQNENDINTKNILDSFQSKEFCICADFGRFSYYDSHNLDEDIYFCNHKSINCSPEIILSMYDEEYSYEIDTTVLHGHLDENNIDLYPHSICWNDHKGEKDSKYLNDKVSDPKDECILSNKIEEIDQNDELSCGSELNVDSWELLDKCIEFFSEANVDMHNNGTNQIMERQSETNVTDTETSIENNTVETVSQVSEEIQNEITSNQIVSLKPVDDNFETEDINNHEVVPKVYEGFQDGISTGQVESLTQTETDVVPKDIFSMVTDPKNNEQYQDNIPNQTKTDKDFSERKECIEFDSASQVIDNDETSAPCSSGLELSAVTNINDDNKNNDNLVLPHKIGMINDLKIQSETGGLQKRPLKKDKNNTRLKEAGDDTTLVSKRIQHAEDDIATQNTTEVKRKVPKKRKFYSTRSSTNEESTFEPHSKKKIKCGVCEQLQSEAEWENHAENEHCFIAWKVDETINLKDAELYQKLKRKLKQDGELECTFCGNINKFPRRFLTHVKKCLDSYAGEQCVKCGVCKIILKESCWMEHIAEHNYIAWKHTEAPIDIDDEVELKQYLLKICKENGGLVCSKCGLSRKYVKSYLSHIENCDVSQDDENNDTNPTSDSDEKIICDKIVKCGVCQVDVKESEWIKHIELEHNYLAWVDGTSPLDIDDGAEVQRHLKIISKENGGLNCSKCGTNRRYVKKYLEHVRICSEYMKSPRRDDASITEIVDDALSSIFEKSISDIIDKNPEGTVECGVCHAELQSSEWLTHIQILHNYKAWIQGQPVLNVADDVMVQTYLNVISKRNDGLICHMCGFKNNEAYFYLNHIESCKSTVKYDLQITPCTNKDDDNGTTGSSIQYKVEINPVPAPQQHQILSGVEGTNPKSDEYQCAVCHENVKRKKWRNHAMKMHYNIAWAVGDTPIDLKKPYVVEKYLKEYKMHHTLVCKVCGISRTSCVGFYAHILVCGKTEEEASIFKEHCNICNNSYLCIYKSQHMTAHREQEYAKERKVMNEKLSVKKKAEVTESPSGRRKAAEKARHDIEKYTTILKESTHTCSSCKLAMESKEELTNHTCVGYVECSSDSDASVKLEQCSDDDDDVEDDELIESNDEIFNEDEELVENKKKRIRESFPTQHKKPRIPFNVSDPDSYLQQSSKDFYQTHYTSEVLFNKWRNGEYESVLECELSRYLPPVEKSCNLKFGTDSWTTYNRFEAKREKGWILFAGACVQCICWVPQHLQDAAGEDGHYLAVACHNSIDIPRYNYDQIAEHANSIQIWNMGDFKTSLPKFVFAISHDFGTVWSMDWCPSGTRDVLSQPALEVELRLGLLAVACSNGTAYIFSVPYPSSVTQRDKHVFYKLKPVVEMRLTMNANRRIYQATSICWSPQKGHATVIVGYADGTMAFFDLTCDSPILRRKENNTTILYPYEDNRPQNSCITDVGVYPRAQWAGAGAGAGAVCSASAGGAGARTGRGGRALHAHVAAARATFAPHWPAVLLAGDEYIVNLCVNELELSGGGAGRRLGTARAWAASGRLARAAAHSPPMLRLMRTHPVHKELHKPVIGLLQMTAINRKRNWKKENDELALTLEPTTYEAAIEKYGIEYTFVNPKDKVEQNKALSTNKERWLERFPLSDVTSMAFCNSERHDNKLAVALHAGLIFIIKV